MHLVVYIALRIYTYSVHACDHAFMSWNQLQLLLYASTVHAYCPTSTIIQDYSARFECVLLFISRGICSCLWHWLPMNMIRERRHCRLQYILFFLAAASMPVSGETGGAAWSQRPGTHQAFESEACSVLAASFQRLAIETIACDAFVLFLSEESDLRL